MNLYLRCFALLCGLHSASFVSEWVYQCWCYPISVSGYFISLFTQSSTMCTALRDMSFRMDTMFIHIVLTLCVATLTKLKRNQSM